jgi:23S rRNA (cytidine1920-2'-O)/16S rRNA (cytidine1409-2'-O)-methyltransferase
MRSDQALVERGLAPDIAAARILIMSGKVRTADRIVQNASETVKLQDELFIKGEKKFVSRAGDKLMGAIEDLKITELFMEATILDVGSSTGGFTDASLQLGAKKVYAVDVGTNQLDWKLRSDERVISMENTDIRKVDSFPKDEISGVVTDVSFISLAGIVSNICQVVKNSNPFYLLLVKPQFEVPKDLVPEGGVVDSDDLREMACKRVEKAFSELGFEKGVFVESKIPGRQGNREIFYYVSSDMKIPQSN